jgi:Ni/Fe-hydrogenase subunit HybB-like protein
MDEKTAVQEINNGNTITAFLKNEFKPKGKPFTLFNVLSLPIILIGGALLLYRLVVGLGVANSSNEFPWGIWIGAVVMVGVAFAGGAYVVAFMVYVLRAKKYHPIVRMAVLNGFLAYVFYAGAIFIDCGRWWNIVNPIIGKFFGVNSVLFLVAWHFLLYMLAQLVEISPAFAEWIGLQRARKILASMTLGAVVFGITLSTLHQSGLGALFLMAKWKIHPLWYSEFIPLLFFVSSIFAGLSVVIFIGMISLRIFGPEQLDEEFRNAWKEIAVGLGKICALTMFVYCFMKLLMLVHGHQWSLLNTSMGYWYLTEVVGLTLIPCIMFIEGSRHKNLPIIYAAAILTMIGIIINRINYSVIAFKWYVPMSARYVPSWIEVITTLSIVFTVVWIFRWIVNRMPVLRRPPEWAAHESEG